MTEFLVFIWGLSAAFAVEIQVEEMPWQPWQQTMLCSLLPIYNTMLVLHFMWHYYFSKR